MSTFHCVRGQSIQMWLNSFLTDSKKDKSLCVSILDLSVTQYSLWFTLIFALEPKVNSKLHVEEIRAVQVDSSTTYNWKHLHPGDWWPFYNTNPLFAPFLESTEDYSCLTGLGRGLFSALVPRGQLTHGQRVWGLTFDQQQLEQKTFVRKRILKMMVLKVGTLPTLQAAATWGFLLEPSEARRDLW